MAQINPNVNITSPNIFTNANTTGNVIYSPQPQRSAIIDDSSKFKLTVYQNDGIEEEYDVRTMLLLFRKLIENSDLEGLLDMDYEKVKILLDRDKKLDDLLDDDL